MIAWIGTIGGIIGAFLVASGLMVIGYCSFLIGAICCFYCAFKDGNRSLMVQFGFFLCANVLGLWKNI
jgi:hypothetical protein